MFSITLKRSAATLVVVAGLLAAAGPATPKPSVVVIDLDDPFFRLASNDTLYARGAQVGSEGVKDDGVPLETVSFTFKGEVIGLEPNALGTQVGSEGVKAANNLRGEAIDIIP
jgi:hypothetical protein